MDEITSRRPMSLAMLVRWRPRIERRTATSLWGQRRWVVPRLVPFLWGDGKQWVWLEPINRRPRYYVLRIDSRMSLSNWEQVRPPFGPVCLDSVLSAIAETWGEQYEDGPRETWPALNWANGGSWGGYTPPVVRR